MEHRVNNARLINYKPYSVRVIMFGCRFGGGTMEMGRHSVIISIQTANYTRARSRCGASSDGIPDFTAGIENSLIQVESAASRF